MSVKGDLGHSRVRQRALREIHQMNLISSAFQLRPCPVHPRHRCPFGQIDGFPGQCGVKPQHHRSNKLTNGPPILARKDGPFGQPRSELSLTSICSFRLDKSHICPANALLHQKVKIHKTFLSKWRLKKSLRETLQLAFIETETFAGKRFCEGPIKEME